MYYSVRMDDFETIIHPFVYGRGIPEGIRAYIFVL